MLVSNESGRRPSAVHTGGRCWSVSPVSVRASATIVEVPASHVSFVSQPDAAIQLILQADEATMATAGRT